MNDLLGRMDRLREWLAKQDLRFVFVTVSGAHLYGFPSPDSDIDLRGSHLLPLADVIGLHEPVETRTQTQVVDGIEVDFVSHDLRKFLQLLTKKNGYVLEQVLSPLVVVDSPLLARLKELALGAMTKHLFHHYRGFAENQVRQIGQEDPPRAKSLLYLYRVLLTGIHALEEHKIEANLNTLLALYPVEGAADLIARKTREKAPLTLDEARGALARGEALRMRLQQAFERTTLPDKPPNAAELERFLIEARLSAPR